HAQGDEEKLAHRGLVRLAGDDLDEPAEHREARVRVMPDLAERGQLLELGHRRDIARERVVTLAEIRETVAEPATRVGHEVPERRAPRDVLVAQLELRKVAADRRVEVE